MIYAVISLLTSILCIFLANFIYYKNPKNRLNQLTALMSLMLAYLLFVEFGYRSASTLYMANLWFKLGFIWPIVATLVFHVTLIITGNSKLTDNKKFLFLIYMPAIVLAIIGLSTNWIYNGMILAYWGWTYSLPSDPSLFYIGNIWLTILFSISILLSIFHYIKSKGREKKLAKYILFGLSTTMAAGLITEVILPAFSIKVPEITYSIASLGIVFLCYGIIKYRIPLLSPSMAADDIVATMSNFMVLMDEKGSINNINPAGLDLLGYKNSEIIGENIKKIFPDDFNIPMNLEEIGNKYGFETSIIDKNGNSRPVFLSITPIIHKFQRLGILCVGSDISDLKEEDIKKRLIAKQTIHRQNVLLELSRKRFSNLQESLQKFTEISSRTLNVDLVSIWFFNSTKTELICKDMYNLKTKKHDKSDVLRVELYPRYFGALEIFHNITANDVRNHYATLELNKTYFGPKKIFSLMDIPIWLEGELIGVLCHENFEIKDWTLEDQEFGASIAHMVSLEIETSGRKKAEKKLRTSLNEKEILLKEIHHRVKNNLTVISSLLRLQSRYIKDKRALDIFKESQNRAKSMALIHEKLYKSEDLRKMDFSDYLKSLTSQLFQSYNTSPGIKLNMEIDNLDLDINTSVPLALIVNEIMSNSLKHAFSGKETGNIWVNFCKNGDMYELIVEDDGIGFPDDLNFENTESLGMQIVNSLIKQINGEIIMEKTLGTRFTVNFKDKFSRNN